MSRNTKALSGASQKKYFRDLLGAQTALTPDARAELLAATEAEIAQVRVRLPIPERRRIADRGKATLASVPVPEADAPLAAAAQPSTAPFDPFAFSAVVVMTKEGPDGLAAKLAEIATAEDLRALAKAQHIPIGTGMEDVTVLRVAILDGTRKRIADRRAAGS
ncbi:MAG: hypothetical protein NW216_04380 [Hyphomicrobium sp.]|nr:hypothetical protein [Hyphomicrobium sp.]